MGVGYHHGRFAVVFDHCQRPAAGEPALVARRPRSVVGLQCGVYEQWPCDRFCSERFSWGCRYGAAGFGDAGANGGGCRGSRALAARSSTSGPESNPGCGYRLIMHDSDHS